MAIAATAEAIGFRCFGDVAPSAHMQQLPRNFRRTYLDFRSSSCSIT
jgi:hypothetical protein